MSEVILVPTTPHTWDITDGVHRLGSIRRDEDGLWWPVDPPAPWPGGYHGTLVRDDAVEAVMCAVECRRSGLL